MLYFHGEKIRTWPHSRTAAPTDGPASRMSGVAPRLTRCAAAASPTGPAPITATGSSLFNTFVPSLSPPAACDNILMLVNIQIGRYSQRRGRREDPSSPRRADTPGYRPAAGLGRRGLRLRLHRLLRRQPADGLAPPQGATRGRRRDLRAPRNVDLLPARREDRGSDRQARSPVNGGGDAGAQESDSEAGAGARMRSPG